MIDLTVQPSVYRKQSNVIGIRNVETLLSSLKTRILKCGLESGHRVLEPSFMNQNEEGCHECGSGVGSTKTRRSEYMNLNSVSGSQHAGACLR